MKEIPVGHRVVVLIWYQDLNDYVRSLFPNRRWDFSHHCESAQDTIHSITVDLSDYDFEDIEYKFDAWLDSTPPTMFDSDFPEDLSVEDFFHVLARRGFWPEGEFSVHVWW